MDFSDCAEGLNKGSCSIAELTNVNQAVPHSGKPWHVSVTLLYSWRNGITISYELNCSCQTCLVSTHGSDTSIWPCPGRRERMYRTCRMQISWVQWRHGVFVIIKPKRYISVCWLDIGDGFCSSEHANYFMPESSQEQFSKDP